MTEQWRELKEAVIEMRDNDGTGTQQEACKYLANLMNVLEKQMPKTGHWIYGTDEETGERDLYPWTCSECGEKYPWEPKYCPYCGCRMEREG